MAGKNSNIQRNETGGRLDPRSALVVLFACWLLIGVAWGQEKKGQGGDAKAAQAVRPPTAEAFKDFWSFQPVKKVAPPAVRNEAWVRNEVDRFILAKLEAAGLTPSRQADKLSLLRRATFDLTGLPPTVAEIKAYMADTSPRSYENLIERLLASPHYGERWGRHWLDVARYVQGRVKVHGVQNTQAAEAYREYVVEAMNEDKPYDRFVIEQIAGDLLPPPVPQGPEGTISPADRKAYYQRITAPAYLSIGAWYDECTDPNRLALDMTDEMIHATTRGIMGLSLACARCHDHKFDPVPTRDYYALAGIFRSTRLVGQFNENWKDGRIRGTRPLALPHEVKADEALAERIEARRVMLVSLQERGQRMLRARLEKALAQADATANLPLPGGRAPRVIEPDQYARSANLKIVREKAERIDEAEGAGTDAVFLETQIPRQPHVEYHLDAARGAKHHIEIFYTSDGTRPVQAQINGAALDAPACTADTLGWSDSHVMRQSIGPVELKPGRNTIRLQAKGQWFPRLRAIRVYPVDEAWERRIAQRAAEAGLPPGLVREMALSGVKQALAAGHNQCVEWMDEADRADIDRQRSEIDALKASIAVRSHVIAVVDEPAPMDMAVHPGGQVYETDGAPVARGVPGMFDSLLERPPVPADRSGRLELARWLTDRRHPLTARVMVNRIWQHHFGRGIVETVSDFGSRGTAPTHPELLDWLAGRFMEEGWSIKAMHRTMMLSATYRMSSEPRRAGAGGPGAEADADELYETVDPANRLLWRFNRRRLEAEAIFDAMQTLAGKITRQPAGAPLDVNKSKDRAMYILTSGRSPLGLGIEIRKMMPLFDYDPSGAMIDQRQESITPTQGLWWLNNRIVKHYGDQLAVRLLGMKELTDGQRVEHAYLMTLGRPADEMEQAMAARYLAGERAAGFGVEDAWSRFCLALISCNEFRYVD